MKSTILITVIALSVVLIHSAILNEEKRNGEDIAIKELQDENNNAAAVGNRGPSRQKRDKKFHRYYIPSSSSSSSSSSEEDISVINREGRSGGRRNTKYRYRYLRSVGPAPQDPAYPVSQGRSGGRRNTKARMQGRVLRRL